MKISDLVKHIAKHEGKKSQVKIGDIREIVGIISDLVYETYTQDLAMFFVLYQNGKRRARSKIKKGEK
jgi:hypothetical protein